MMTTMLGLSAAAAGLAIHANASAETAHSCNNFFFMFFLLVGIFSPAGENLFSCMWQFSVLP
jgi:hypothetical protein